MAEPNDLSELYARIDELQEAVSAEMYQQGADLRILLIRVTAVALLVAVLCAVMLGVCIWLA